MNLCVMRPRRWSSRPICAHRRPGARCLPSRDRRTSRVLLPPLTALALLAGACDEEPPRISHDELELACVRRNACDVMAYARVADCMDAFYTLHQPAGLGRTYAALYQCVNAAGSDCAAMRACFGIPGEGAACDRTFTARCDGRQAISCDLLSDQLFTLDCGASGLRCAVSERQGFDARCTPGGCTPGEARRCDGDRRLSCADGLWEVTDCSARGLTCVSAPESSAECAGAEGPCAGPDRCEGTTAIRCVNGGAQRLQCADLPLSSACEAGRCVRAGDACSDELDRCEGADLKLCLDGRWERIDCAELGLGPCQPSAQGASCGGG